MQVAAAPRLSTHAQARLRTHTIIWPASSQTLEEYVHKSLGVPLSLMPTVLGLRLVTDLAAGRDGPLPLEAISVRT